MGAAKAEVAFTEGDFCVIGVRTIGGRRASISLSGSSLFNERDHQLQIRLSQEAEFALE